MFFVLRVVEELDRPGELPEDSAWACALNNEGNLENCLELECFGRDPSKKWEESTLTYYSYY